jgi:hypothetical protein
MVLALALKVECLLVTEAVGVQLVRFWWKEKTFVRALWVRSSTTELVSAQKEECLSAMEAVDVHLARSSGKKAEKADVYALQARIRTMEHAPARQALFLSVTESAGALLANSPMETADVRALKARMLTTEHARVRLPQYLSLMGDADVHPVR